MHLLVLSAFRQRNRGRARPRPVRFNAPSGAWCFPTKRQKPTVKRHLPSQCTFWCLVLSDPGDSRRLFSLRLSFNAPSGAWCFRTRPCAPRTSSCLAFQCTFWCSVLSDRVRGCATYPRLSSCLNAPSGARCFPTMRATDIPPTVGKKRLNAPSGA